MASPRTDRPRASSRTQLPNRPRNLRGTQLPNRPPSIDRYPFPLPDPVPAAQAVKPVVLPSAPTSTPPSTLQSATTSAPSQQHPVTKPARRRRPRVLEIAVGVGVVAALVIAVVVYLAVRSDSGSGTSPRAAATSTGAKPTDSTSDTPAARLSATQRNQRHALAWMAANLPRNVPVLATPSVRGRLKTLGFTAARSALGASLPRFVVSDAALRAKSTTGAVLDRSVAVARFGALSGRVEVRSVLSIAAGRVRAMLAADRANRRAAGTALLTNPQLSVTPPARTVLRAGDLDLRAATYLAMLASDTRARLTALPIDPAELAAAQPRRIVVLAATGAAAAAIRAAATALPPAYAPAKVDSSTPGSVTLTWSATGQPVEPVT